jgi:hypothetical protein
MLLEGVLARLSTASQGDTVAEEAGVELVFGPSPRLPLSERLLTTVTMADTDIAWRTVGGRHACDVLGSKVEVSRDPWSENLWLIATTSKNLPHPFLENWVSEPLRVLCGQLVYPRFVARNFGCGRAFVDIRPSPSLRSRLGGCVVFLGRTVDAFWGFYERYLAYLSRFCGPNGQPVLESNPLTRLHEEVIQAANGSKWMFELALTSAIEGACRLAVAPQTLPTDFDPKEIDSVRELINSWPEHKAVGSRLLAYLDFMKQPSAGAHLRGLVENSVIRKAHRDAWMEVRHPAAHGELGDPRPSEASEEQLNLLLELLYILTIRIIEANPEATPRTE